MSQTVVSHETDVSCESSIHNQIAVSQGAVLKKQIFIKTAGMPKQLFLKQWFPFVHEIHAPFITKISDVTKQLFLNQLFSAYVTKTSAS